MHAGSSLPSYMVSALFIAAVLKEKEKAFSNHDEKGKVLQDNKLTCVFLRGVAGNMFRFNSVATLIENCSVSFSKEGTGGRRLTVWPSSIFWSCSTIQCGEKENWAAGKKRKEEE